jgi:XTP/dITP diphosphohydrolase
VPNLLIATGNAGKARELARMLGYEIDWTDLSSIPNPATVEETGVTFRENACLKAEQYARMANLWTLADDSGLEVDALDGKPGVISARWAESHNAGKGDDDNNCLLLQQLQKIPDDLRAARFVCVLALADPNGNIVLTARDTVEGRIIHKPRGENGFGYDPLFMVAGLDRTSAELEPDEKNRVSHRGKALRRLQSMMERSGWFELDRCST